MKNIIIFGILFSVVLILGCTLTESNVERVAGMLQEKYDSLDDYTMTITEHNHLTKEKRTSTISVLKPNYYKSVSEDGTVHVSKHTVITPDFYSLLISLLDDPSGFTFEKSEWNNRSAFKMVRTTERYSEIWYMDEETMLPLYIEKRLPQDYCERLMQAFNEYDLDELGSCVSYSTNVTDLKVNQGLTEADFIISEVPIDEVGACRPEEEIGKPLNESAFTVYMPTRLPEVCLLKEYQRSTVNVHLAIPGEEGRPAQPSATTVSCPQVKGSRVSTRDFYGAEFNAADIVVECSGTYGPGLRIAESDSELLQVSETLRLETPTVRETDINGTAGKIFTFKTDISVYAEDMFIGTFEETTYVVTWKQGETYISLSFDSMPNDYFSATARADREVGIEIPSQSVYQISLDEALAVAGSMKPMDEFTKYEYFEVASKFKEGACVDLVPGEDLCPEFDFKYCTGETTCCILENPCFGKPPVNDDADNSFFTCNEDLEEDPNGEFVCGCSDECEVYLACDLDNGCYGKYPGFWFYCDENYEEIRPRWLDENNFGIPEDALPCMCTEKCLPRLICRTGHCSGRYPGNEFSCDTLNGQLFPSEEGTKTCTCTDDCSITII